MSVNNPLYVAFLWHMHQPYYKDLMTGNYFMPWVRLHAAKDYVDMVLLLDEFPQIRMTVNLVPSLLEQVLDYVENDATDVIWDLSIADPANLSESEKCVILERFFHAQYENMIRPYPRYKELYEMRGWARSQQELRSVVRLYSDQAIRDLQVWYNLVWIDPLFVESDLKLQELFVKGRNFTEDEKLYVLEKHRRILHELVPTYRLRQERGQIEISTTPFYHPILPLICDTNLARVARPEMPLPKRQFQHPEDAEEQVRRAVEFYESLFGRRPRGMWPAEGSVAPNVIPIFAKYGIEWIASDEEVLAHSLGQPIRRDLRGNVLNADTLYRGYWAEHEGSRLQMVFRDHHLSDLIGFQYAGWDPEDAAEDLVRRLELVAKMPEREGRPWLVPIILDGENCWEHYERDGLPFLRALYERLSISGALETVTLADYFDRFPPERTLPKLFAGSWINHDFSIWIGHREDNRSWDYLHDVRDAIVEHIERHRDSLTPEQIEQAWRSLYIAEGSDWNWWYGEDHSSGMDDLFDQLYRDHLTAACRAVGLDPPGFLRIPISRHTAPREATQPVSFISPNLDGHVTHFYEWYGAGHYDPALASTAMHPGRMRLQHLYFGFDADNLYFRIDPDSSLIHSDEVLTVELSLHLLSGENVWRLRVRLEPNGKPRVSTLTASFRHAYGDSRSLKHTPVYAEAMPKMAPGNERTFHLAEPQPEVSPVHARVALGEIVEISIPRALLPLKPNDPLDFFATLEIDGHEIERIPAHAPIHMRIPTDDFEQLQWTV
ncbi:MAG: glycoside hydrolase family 57 protein [Candidatus Sumerlaeaceae bacterium]|nr:glycoside hydrolase family 57 protein [Candidatus Sumerlaeaceae bacterium]